MSAPPHPRSVWRRRDFRLAWTAGLVNDTGDWVLSVALPVYVFTETGSGTVTAALFACQMIVALSLGPLGGSIVDRLNLKRCLLATNIAQTLMLLPLLAVTPNRVWPAFIAVVGQAVLTQLNNPANIALLPRLVDRDQLTKANAALGASSSLARLAGAPLGGLLVAVGGLDVVVLIDAVSYLGAAACIARLRSPTPPLGHDHPTDHTVDRGVRAGLAEIGRRPVLKRFLAVFGLAQIAQGGFVVLFVVFVVDTLDRTGTEVGVIRGTMAVGAVAGAMLIARVGSRVDPLQLVAVGFLGMGVVSLMFWNAPIVTEALWVYIVLFALSGVPGSALSTGIVTTVQTLSPPDALGRVAGVMQASDAIGTAVGAIVTGILIDIAPVTVLLDAQAAVYLVCGALVLGIARSARSPSGATTTIHSDATRAVQH